MKTLDVITIGRSSVDLYGAQVGGRLEDMGSFQKYIGGSPTNMAAGTARLGLKSALITRVGDEHMGRFIREELAREGVDTRGVKTDPDRLTALVLLGIRDDKQFPLIFYRENCADMALCEDDIDAGFIAQSRAVVATGTHLSHPRTTLSCLATTPQARFWPRTQHSSAHHQQWQLAFSVRLAARTWSSCWPMQPRPGPAAARWWCSWRAQHPSGAAARS